MKPKVIHRPLLSKSEMHPFLQKHYEGLVHILQKYRVRKAYIFGSLAQKGIFTDQSDVDLLLVFQKDQKLGLAYMTMWDELESLFDRKVDIISNPKQLQNSHFRKGVQENIQLIYKD